MRYPRLFWATLLPVVLVSSIAVRKLTPALTPPPVSREEIQEAFLNGLTGACAPEPQELIAYVLSVSVAVVLMFGAVIALKLTGKLQSLERHWLATGSVAVVTQALLCVFAGKSWIYENAHNWSGQLNDHAPGQLVLGACLAVYFGYRWMDAESKKLLLSLWQRLSYARVLPTLMALAWTVAHLLECVFTDDNIRRASGTIGYHLPFTMGEFGAVLNGRFPLVDFYSQYQNLLGHLLRPVFLVTGLSITTFTLAMSALSVVGFLLLYRVLWRVSGSAWVGLFLYAPMVALSLAEAEPAGAKPSNSFNYYAVGPIRYFGTFLGAYLALLYLTAPRKGRLLLVSAIAALVGLNNLEFGVPAALGVLAAAILFPPTSATGSRLMHSIRAMLLFVCGAGAGLISFCLYARASTGRWPHPTVLVEYQRAFGYLGFNLAPLPPDGLYWIMYISFMLALLYALFDGFSSNLAHISAARRLSLGMLAYAGIAGLGAGVYFVGRSHPALMVTLYPAWAFVLALLLHRVICDVRSSRIRSDPAGAAIHAIPAASLLTLCVGLTPFVLAFPRVEYEIGRLQHYTGNLNPTPARWAALVAKYVPKDAPTIIVAVDGHQLATQASVQNLYPFAHPGSVLLKSQLRPILESISRLPPGDQYVFGNVWPPVAKAMADAGFRRVDADGDFIVWHAHK